MSSYSKHDRRSHRLRGWDYRKSGHYFVTLCTKNKSAYFSDAGIKEIAETYWRKITERQPHVSVHEFVFMPDHMHGILEILRQPPDTGKPAKRLHCPAGSIGAVVGGYKIAVKKMVQAVYGVTDFHWQRDYYDRIVFDPQDLPQIIEYIKHNQDKLRDR